MHLDQYGLPCQADGDRNDQLQRCGMIITARGLSAEQGLSGFELTCGLALLTKLQPQPGVYVRYIGGATDNVSADQLIAALCAHIANGTRRQAWLMFVTMCKRFGFAQNYKDGLNADTKTKLPDFMLLRGLPLFARMHPSLYVFTLLADALLVLAALSAVGPVFRDGSIVPHRRGPDDVDDNNTILTLAVCRARMPTPLSWLAVKLYSWLRPWNYGCRGIRGIDYGQTVVENMYKPVYGALRWYHRAENGGNPEIAEMWKPIIDRYFGGSQ
jgi:hypothetical protein